jgi:hypothetical protein
MTTMFRGTPLASPTQRSMYSESDNSMDTIFDEEQADLSPICVRRELTEQRDWNGDCWRHASTSISRDAVSVVSKGADRGASVVPNNNNNNIAARQQLYFDLNQPWQRSLQRELKNSDFDQDERQQHDACELLLLGRTESGVDFAVNYLHGDNDDAISLNTDASSTVPIRQQMIHRTPQHFHNDRTLIDQDTDAEDSVYFVDDKVRDVPALHGKSAYKITTDELAQDDQRQDTYTIAMVSQGARRESTSSNNSITHSSAFSEDDDLHWLEMEQHSADDTSMADHSQNGCFCLGYDMMQYLLPPPGTTIAGKQKRYRRNHQRRLLSKPRFLGAVQEEPEAMPKVRSRADPTGEYHDPVQDYRQSIVSA